MKKFERWYDKYTDISQLFYFLESLDERKRKIVANEILQIIFCELNIDANEKVKEFNPHNGKLIYDLSRQRVKAFLIDTNPEGREFFRNYKVVGQVPDWLKRKFGW